MARFIQLTPRLFGFTNSLLRLGAILVQHILDIPHRNIHFIQLFLGKLGMAAGFLDRGFRLQDAFFNIVDLGTQRGGFRLAGASAG